MSSELPPSPDSETQERAEKTDNQSLRGFFSLTFRIGPVLSLLTLLACLPTWLGLGARAWWLLELATHFTWHYAVLLPLFFVANWWTGKKRFLWLVVVTLALNLWKLAPYYLPIYESVSEGDPAAEEPALRVMTLNVLTLNTQYVEVLRLVEQEKPNVLVLLEVNQAWNDALLSELRFEYPTQLLRPRSDNFGIAYYSQLESTELINHDFGDAELPSVVARLKWQGEPLTIVCTHPLPPTSATNARLRNTQLAAVAQFAAEQPGSIIVVGDLNTTPFSPPFRDLLKQGHLVDSSHGRGLHATWSTSVEWLGLPIDHVLHSPDLVVHNRRIGPQVGSDHRAVIVEFESKSGER